MNGDPFPLQPTPSLAELAPAAGPIAAAIVELLQSTAVEALPPESQGKYIADRFAGNVTAEWSKGTFGDVQQQTPSRILRGVEAAFNGSKDASTWQQNVRTITRTGGLRMAVGVMSEDVRTGTSLGAIGAAVAETPEGPTLTSLAQIEGYVYGLAGNKFRPWQQAVLEEVSRYIQSKDESPNAHWQLKTASSLRGSDIPYIRNLQLAWDETARAAAEDGIDFELIARSAEAARAQYRTSTALGAAILRETAPKQTYDHLFE